MRAFLWTMFILEGLSAVTYFQRVWDAEPSNQSAETVRRNNAINLVATLLLLFWIVSLLV